MIFNITNPKAKTQIHRSLLLRELGIERGFAKRMRHVLNTAYFEVATHIAQQGTDVGINILLDRRLSDLFSVFILGYRRAASSALDLVEQSLKGLKSGQGMEQKAMQDDFWYAFNRRIIAKTASQVTKVGNATKKFIKRTIDRGVKDGKSYGQIAKDLKGKKAFNAKRAMRIARTEVHSVSTYATQEAVRSTRLEMEKEWVTFIDKRTRTDHIRMNGERKPMDEDFTVGGEQMAHPGDPRGGAKNVIHCRCVLLYHEAKPRESGTQEAQPSQEEEFIPTKEMKQAVAEYTGSSNVPINEALRKGKALDELLTEDVKQIDLFLKKSPKYMGEVYRRISSEKIWKTGVGKAMTTPGKSFMDKAYISTTSSKGYYKNNLIAKNSKEINCIIQSKRGVSVSKYSQFKTEKEVLLPRGSKFKVQKAVQDKETKIWTTWLKEV